MKIEQSDLYLDLSDTSVLYLSRFSEGRDKDDIEITNRPHLQLAYAAVAECIKCDFEYTTLGELAVEELVNPILEQNYERLGVFEA